ncbi:MAG: macro domain-containing protein, partial [Phycisphaerales bacterium]|nr:macro domain-containing protein [Phycisphaerales bacterium]
TVVVTGPGPLTNCAHIIHAVSIDVWYKSSAERIDQTVRNVLGKAQELNARSVALPGLAMGYGQLPAEEFATGLRSAITASDWAIDELRVILYRADDAQIVARVLGVELES